MWYFVNPAGEVIRVSIITGLTLTSDSPSATADITCTIDSAFSCTSDTDNENTCKASINTTVLGLTIVLSTATTTTASLTCTLSSPVVCLAGTATAVSCTAASITTEGTYKLSGTLTFTATQIDGSTSVSVTPTLGTTTLTVSNTSSSNNSKYLNASLCFHFFKLI